MARRLAKPCRRCPEQPQIPSSIKVAADKADNGAQLHPKILTSEGEADRLWRHIFFGTGTCVGMIEGYCRLGMPGDPLPALYELRKRIDDLITKVEHASKDSVLQSVPSDSELPGRDDSEPNILGVS